MPLEGVHPHHRPASAGAVERDDALPASEPLAHLQEVERPAVVVLLDVPRDALERGRRVAELARDLDPEIGVPEHRCVVERDPAVEGHHPAVAGEDQRVDLRRARLEPARDSREPHRRLGELALLLAVHAHASPQLAGGVQRETFDNVERELRDRLRVLASGLLDPGASPRRDEKHRAAPAVVQDDAGVALARDRHPLLDENLDDRKPSRVAREDRGRRLAGRVGRFRETNQALRGAARGPGLSLHDDSAADVRGHGCGLVPGSGQRTARYRDAGAEEDLLPFELCETCHENSPPARGRPATYAMASGVSRGAGQDSRPTRGADSPRGMMSSPSGGRMVHVSSVPGSCYFYYPRLVCVVGVRDESRSTTNFAPVAWTTPLSSDPPLFGVCLSPKTYSHQLALKTGEFTVNFLTEKHARPRRRTGAAVGPRDRQGQGSCRSTWSPAMRCRPRC